MVAPNISFGFGIQEATASADVAALGELLADWRI